MEKRLKQQLTRIRLATIALRHNLRHTFDEFRERFISWRPTEAVAMPIPTSEPALSKPSLSTPSFDRRSAVLWAFLAFLFILSIIVGATLKTSADERFTIGHEDYRLTPAERLYDLNTLREKALASGAPLTVDSKPVYPVCTDDVDVSVDETAL